VYGVRWVATAMPAEVPRSLMPVLDGAVLVYTIAVSVIAGMVFGIAPALHSFGDDLREALGENSRGGTASRRRKRLRCAVVVAEVLSGIADLVLAGLIISGWPGTASWALGLIVGVNLITSGLAITMAALAGRSLVKAVTSTTR